MVRMLLCCKPLLLYSQSQLLYSSSLEFLIGIESRRSDSKLQWSFAATAAPPHRLLHQASTWMASGSLLLACSTPTWPSENSFACPHTSFSFCPPTPLHAPPTRPAPPADPPATPPVPHAAAPPRRRAAAAPPGAGGDFSSPDHSQLCARFVLLI
eukprot:COSAG01_NODE_6247_length_3771_cov_379.905229_6_plen_155_part_00